jgi:DNA-binding transcriptional MerR regulator
MVHLARDFENREAAQIVGVNPRTIIDWTELGLVVSGVRAADGAGTRRRYSEHDLVQLAIVKTLLGDGIPRKVVRQALGVAREFSRKDTLFSIPPGAENPFALSTEIEAFVDFYLLFDLQAWRMELGLVRKAGQTRKIRIGTALKELADPEATFAELGKKALSMGRAYVLNLSAVKADVREQIEQ